MRRGGFHTFVGYVVIDDNKLRCNVRHLAFEMSREGGREREGEREGEK